MHLSYETIMAAVAGDKKAIEEVVAAYEPYINALAMLEYRDEDGNRVKRFSPDAKQVLQQKLIEKIPDWKELVT